MSLPRNEGVLDRVVRVVIALVLFMFAAAMGGGMGILLALVGVVMLATSALGFCGLYAVLGIRTCPVDSAKK